MPPHPPLGATTPRDARDAKDGPMARLLAMAKDHETICSQLMETAQHFEVQLRAMRAEHQTLRLEVHALRRCLDRAGLGPGSDVSKAALPLGNASHSPEKREDLAFTERRHLAMMSMTCPETVFVQHEEEAQHITAATSVEDFPVLSAVTISTPAEPSGASVTSRRRNAAGQPPAEAVTAATAVPSSRARRRSPDSPQCGDQAQPAPAPPPAASGRVTAAEPREPRRAGAGTSATAATVPPSRIPRGRSANKSTERAESPEEHQQHRATRSRSLHRASEGRVEPLEIAQNVDEDLYELMSKLMDKDSSVADQQHAGRTLQQLLKRSATPPNTWSGPGTPLSAVVRVGRSDLARLLLRARASVNERDAKGVSALHVATFDGNADLCKVLLTAKSEVDACDRYGQTPLFFAPNREMCKLLIERRADVTVLNRKGQSALHLAGRAGLPEVLAWLTSRVSKQLVDLKDMHGATARNYAQQQSGPEGAKTEASQAAPAPTRRAASPLVRVLPPPANGSSPPLSARAVSPQRPERLLRGGGGRGMRATGQEGQAPTSRSTQRRTSELDNVSVSELVTNRYRPEGERARTTDAQGSEVGDQEEIMREPNLPGAEVQRGDAGDQCRVRTEEGLEAAAALATAAVATAAELEASKAAEIEQEVREEWASQLAQHDSQQEDAQHRRSSVTEDGPLRRGVSNPQELLSPAVSAINNVSEMGNEIPELSVMDSKPDCPFEGAALSTNAPGVAAAPQPAVLGSTCTSTIQEVVEPTEDDPTLEDELDEVY